MGHPFYVFLNKLWMFSVWICANLRKGCSLCLPGAVTSVSLALIDAINILEII